MAVLTRKLTCTAITPTSRGAINKAVADFRQVQSIAQLVTPPAQPQQVRHLHQQMQPGPQHHTPRQSVDTHGRRQHPDADDLPQRVHRRCDGWEKKMLVRVEDARHQDADAEQHHRRELYAQQRNAQIETIGICETGC